jgi:hypothetical protein
MAPQQRSPISDEEGRLLAERFPLLEAAVAHQRKESSRLRREVQRAKAILGANTHPLVRGVAAVSFQVEWAADATSDSPSDRRLPTIVVRAAARHARKRAVAAAAQADMVSLLRRTGITSRWALTRRPVLRRPRDLTRRTPRISRHRRISARARSPGRPDDDPDPGRRSARSRQTQSQRSGLALPFWGRS